MSILDIRASILKLAEPVFTTILVPSPYFRPPQYKIVPTKVSSHTDLTWPSGLMCTVHQCLFSVIGENMFLVWSDENGSEGNYAPLKGGVLGGMYS